MRLAFRSHEGAAQLVIFERGSGKDALVIDLTPIQVASLNAKTAEYVWRHFDQIEGEVTG